MERRLKLAQMSIERSMRLIDQTIAERTSITDGRSQALEALRAARKHLDRYLIVFAERKAAASGLERR